MLGFFSGITACSSHIQTCLNVLEIRELTGTWFFVLSKVMPMASPVGRSPVSCCWSWLAGFASSWIVIIPNKYWIVIQPHNHPSTIISELYHYIILSHTISPSFFWYLKLLWMMVKSPWNHHQQEITGVWCAAAHVESKAKPSLPRLSFFSPSFCISSISSW